MVTLMVDITKWVTSWEVERAGSFQGRPDIGKAIVETIKSIAMIPRVGLRKFPKIEAEQSWRAWPEEETFFGDNQWLEDREAEGKLPNLAEPGYCWVRPRKAHQREASGEAVAIYMLNIEAKTRHRVQQDGRGGNVLMANAAAWRDSLGRA